ncbi:MAG: hypothetical protein HOP28_12290 [Gemmatimonadales bacterium]|nr:hypothetical protein [Gemmatimonadales bacterium]
MIRAAWEFLRQDRLLLTVALLAVVSVALFAALLIRIARDNRRVPPPAPPLKPWDHWRDGVR